MPVDKQEIQRDRGKINLHETRSRALWRDSPSVAVDRSFCALRPEKNTNTSYTHMATVGVKGLIVFSHSADLIRITNNHGNEQASSAVHRTGVTSEIQECSTLGPMDHAT